MHWNKLAPGLALTLALLGCSGSGGGAPSDGAAMSGDAATAGSDAGLGLLKVTSSAFVEAGVLPVEHTCDGAGLSPPLAFGGAPAGTKELALMATTVARDGLKWSWVLYSIPANTTMLAKGSMGVGKAGLTSDGPALAYSPPCSQGPGAKTYTFTVYALSASPALPAMANQVTGAVLTSAISGITLGSGQINVSSTR